MPQAMKAYNFADTGHVSGPLNTFVLMWGIELAEAFDARFRESTKKSPFPTQKIALPSKNPSKKLKNRISIVFYSGIFTTFALL